MDAGHGNRDAHTVALHDLEELDDDLGARSDQDLALAGLLGVVDAVERIVEDRSANHLGVVSRLEILNSLTEKRGIYQSRRVSLRRLLSVESAHLLQGLQ